MTLEQIWDKLADLLEIDYQVERKRSALRLKTKKGKDLNMIDTLCPVATSAIPAPMCSCTRMKVTRSV